MIYAGFWKRLAAAWIDILVTYAVLMIYGLSYVFVFLLPEFTSATPREFIGENINLYGYSITLAITWLYFAVFESSKKQATLGKLAVGIKVTDLNGNRIGFGRASGRFFGKFISATIIGIGYLMAAFTKRKQGLHDMMAGCLVIRQDAATPDSNETREDSTVE